MVGSELPCITVLAGTNGAGKSSIAGAMIRHQRGEYFNPDEAARKVRTANPALSQTEANSAAWKKGRDLLAHAIDARLDFTFETTLGGETITALLERALDAGSEVRIWYAGLATPELHLARVKARVSRGGHDIPEQRIRERYDKSRANLIRLLPRLTELVVFDNSDEADPAAGVAPKPRLIVHMIQGSIAESCDLAAVPQWAKPIVMAAKRRLR